MDTAFYNGCFLGAAIVFVLMGFAMFLLDVSATKQAVDRGYMVECIGKTGYYWKGECDE